MLEESIIITSDLFEKGKSSNGGWNTKQLAAIGIESMQTGWMRRAIGTKVSKEQVELFLALKDSHLKGKTIERLSGLKGISAKKIYKMASTMDEEMFIKSFCACFDVFEKK